MGDTPAINFSKWVPWLHRDELKRADGPWLGLYLWARFDRAPGETIQAHPLVPKQVIYVGETKNLDLRPLTGGHHRLVHYVDTFPDDGNFKRLYVSVCRVCQFPNGYGTDEAQELYRRLRVYTQYIEAKIYWEYTERWGCPPALHYKKPRKDTDDS